MQIVIDIPEEIYENINNHSGMAYAVEDYLHEVEWAIKKGTSLPDNATNGDVIKTLFPFVTKHISHSENNIYIDAPIQATVLAFDRYWWNAPYKAESEEV